MLSEKLKVNISNDDMWAFIAGFDSGGNEGEKTNAFVNLGVDLHKKYIKEKK